MHKPVIVLGWFFYIIWSYGHTVRHDFLTAETCWNIQRPAFKFITTKDAHVTDCFPDNKPVSKK